MSGRTGKTKGENIIQPEILLRMRDAFQQLKTEGKLHHGSGTFDYGDWAVWL